MVEAKSQMIRLKTANNIDNMIDKDKVILNILENILNVFDILPCFGLSPIFITRGYTVPEEERLYHSQKWK